jgi:hypothetical protein
MPAIQLLHGGSASITLGGGYTLRAPGLKGTVCVLGPKAVGSRGPERSTAAFDRAFAQAGIEEVTAIELVVAAAPFPAAAAPVRGPDGADAFELQVPDLGPDYGQVVLAIDEGGAMHWHFPVDDELQVQASTTRGAGGSKTFLIPREIAAAPAAGPARERGLVSILGRKLLKVLIYPIADAVLGPLTDLAVGRWEASRRPHGVRRFLAGDKAALTPADWHELAAGRALLFVHGTFSTAQAAFGDLPAATLDVLAARYAGRVFAFEHPSLSEHPRTNARWFFAQMPADVSLEVDIVCHSRGGLVSRCLASRAADVGIDPARFRVRRMVLAGVPNQGTLLANPDHMVSFLDRMTTALNFFPDNGVTDVLEAILTVVKVAGHAGLSGLEGLAAMRPGNDFLDELDRSAIPGCTFFGLGGDFEPSGAGLGAAFCKAADSLIDRVFEDAPNDLVVPTAGMRAWQGAVQIPDERFLSFPASRGVMHTSYFPQPETSASLLRWLC